MGIRDPRGILITGASSGIGEALAKHYAPRGVRLCLTGRNAQRLEGVAASCEGFGAAVESACIDVTDAAAVASQWIAWDDDHPIDLVIANAGLSGGAAGGSETEAQAREIFRTNVDGVLNTIHPLLGRMRERRRGQVALMGSMAGFRGFPSAPAYSASKAAVKAYGEALRPLLRQDGVAVSVICPGFVKSRITAVNEFPMPFLMEAEHAARRIVRGLARNRARIAFPLPMYLAVWFVSLLPPALGDPIVARGPRKASVSSAAPSE